MSVEAAFVFPHPPIIVPSVGRGEEAPAIRTVESCRKAASALVSFDPDVIVISSPHASLVPDGFYITTVAHMRGTMERFGAFNSALRARNDEALAHAIMAEGAACGIGFLGSGPFEVETLDHGTYVPLYFVAEAYAQRDGIDVSAGVPDEYELPVSIVRMGMSGVSGETHRELGRCVARASDALGKRVVYLASGDCAHRLSEDGPYGFHPAAPQLESVFIEAFSTGNLEALFEVDAKLRHDAGDCGCRSFQMMAGAIEGLDYTCTLLSEEAPFGIGYCVATLMEEKA